MPRPLRGIITIKLFYEREFEIDAPSRGALFTMRPEGRDATVFDMNPFDIMHDDKTADLIKALGDEDPGVRLKAVKALGKTRTRRSADALIAILSDKNERVRWAAADSLLEMGELVVESLLDALDAEDKYTRAEAAGVLGKMRNERAIEPLIECMKDDDINVRWIASKALATMGYPAVRPLIDAMDDKSLRIRKRAMDALVKMGQPAIRPLVESLDDQRLRVRWGALEACEHMGSQAAGLLMFALDTGTLRAKWRAATALGRIGDPKALESLIAALRDKHHYVRWKAAEALGAIGDKGAVDALIEALGDENRYVRLGAARSLGILKDERSLPALEEATKDEDVLVQEAAERALRNVRFAIRFGD